MLKLEKIADDGEQERQLKLSKKAEADTELSEENILEAKETEERKLLQRQFDIKYEVFLLVFGGLFGAVLIKLIERLVK